MSFTGKLKKKKMSNLMNTYIPKYVPSDYEWYECDGLLTWYDHRKCEDFLREADFHFKQAKIRNFDIIRKECRGEEIPKNVLVGYQTVRGNDVLKKQKKLLSRLGRSFRLKILTNGCFYG